MRSLWIERAAAAGVLGLLLAGAAPGQQSAPGQSSPPPAEPAPAKPARLEEMLAQALRSNPDVRVAAAKVGEAEAELNRVRLQVVQKVVQAYQAVEAAQAMADLRAKEFQRLKQLADQGTVSAEILSEKENQLAAAKAALAAAEADLRYLLGKQPAGTRHTVGRALNQNFLEELADPDGTVRQWLYVPNVRRQAAAEGPATDKIRKALDRHVSIHLKDAPIKKLLETLIEAVPDVHIQVPPLEEHRNTKVSVQWDSISVAAVLQLVEDLQTGYRFVVRDYGLLLAREDHLPPGAPLLHEFRKDRPAAASEKNPPAENVEGLIKQVDPKSGLVTITIGSDAGLAKGQTLEVFRLTPAPKYLGTIRILEVTASQAVGQPTDRAAAIQAGDRVTSHLPKK
jgi:hypothetical protein